MDSKRVTFNVCGKRWESVISVIESKPDTMLAMLLRRNESHQGEIFLQGDPAMFRWILYYYTTDILVSHDTVGVPKEVWDREIEYYSLFSLEEESKKRPLVDESHELASLAKKQMAEINAKDDEKSEARRKIYKTLLEYMMEHMNKTKDIRTVYAFFGKSPKQKPIDWPRDYPEKLRGIDFGDINRHMQEFVEYCGKTGFKLTKLTYEPSHMGKPAYPIVDGHIKTGHQCMTLGLSLIKDTSSP